MGFIRSIMITCLFFATASWAGSSGLTYTSGGKASPVPVSEKVKSTIVVVLATSDAGWGKEHKDYIHIGLGVVVDANGTIVTDYGSVGSDNTIEVVLNDGRQLAAKVVSREPCLDIVILKVDLPERLPVATFVDSDKVAIGDKIFYYKRDIWWHDRTLAYPGTIVCKPPEDKKASQWCIGGQPSCSLKTGPVLDAEGNIVAIVVASNYWRQQGGDVLYTVPGNKIKEILDQLTKKK
jgi:hypothetical protein